MLKNKADGPCQILTGGVGAGTVDQRECVIAFLRQFQGMGEAVLHGSHIGESASRIAYGKTLTGISPEKEEAGIFLCRVLRFFFLRIYVIKNGVSRFRMVSHVVDDLHRFIRINVVVPGKAQLSQRVTAVVPVLHRKNQPAVVSENRIVNHL